MKVLFGAILLSAAFLAQPAFACSCLPPTEASVLADADVALEGTVLRVRRVGGVNGKLFATIRVTRALKGKLPRRVIVETNGNSAACGVGFERGQSVRFGAAKSGRNYSTGLCSQF
jgi:hypothetical protein